MWNNRHDLRIASIQNEHATANWVKCNALRVLYSIRVGWKTAWQGRCIWETLIIGLDLHQFGIAALEHKQAVRFFIKCHIQRIILDLGEIGRASCRERV